MLFVQVAQSGCGQSGRGLGMVWEGLCRDSVRASVGFSGWGWAEIRGQAVNRSGGFSGACRGCQAVGQGLAGGQGGSGSAWRGLWAGLWCALVDSGSGGGVWYWVTLSGGLGASGGLWRGSGCGVWSGSLAGVSGSGSKGTIVPRSCVGVPHTRQVLVGEW